jgi:Mn-containing catalase
LAAAMRYFTQGWAESDIPRRDMLLDIATEELSHLEMVAQTLTMLLKGSPAAVIDEVEENYLGTLLEGKHDQYIALSQSAQINSGGSGPRLTDSMGTPWTAAYIDTIGQPTADLRSDIAAEARAKITYERLIKQTDDASCKDTLTFLMTREIAHQKMFEAALAAITPNFPPGNLPGLEDVAHTYFKDSFDDGQGKTESKGKGKSGTSPGIELAQGYTDWGFTVLSELDGEEPELPDPKPAVESGALPPK